MKKLILATMLALGTTSFAANVLAAEHGAMSHDMAGHAMQPHANADWANAKESKTIAVEGCWIRSLPAPAPSAGYFVVHNHGKHEVKLQAAASPVYGMIMLHQTTEHEGMSKMSETHDIAIAAAGKLEFKPGGYHAMLERAEKAPAVGSKVKMSFLFDNGEKASAQCDVKAPGARVK